MPAHPLPSGLPQLPVPPPSPPTAGGEAQQPGGAAIRLLILLQQRLAAQHVGDSRLDALQARRLQCAGAGVGACTEPCFTRLKQDQDGSAEGAAQSKLGSAQAAGSPLGNPGRAHARAHAQHGRAGGRTLTWAPAAGL